MAFLRTKNSNKLNFKKCGEALISHDQKMFALSCCFCGAIFMQLQSFGNHILEEHTNELEEAAKNCTTADNGDEERDDIFMDNQSTNEIEVLFDENISENMHIPLCASDKFQDSLSECEWEEEYLCEEDILQSDENCDEQNAKIDCSLTELENKNSVVSFSDNEKTPSMEDKSTISNTGSIQSIWNEVDLKLIELYKAAPCLWNLQHSHFNDKSERQSAYLNITNVLNVSFKKRKRHKLQFVRMRITQICDWYKQQLRMQYRNNMLCKAYEIKNEQHFQSLKFLQNTFMPIIHKEDDKIIRSAVEEQNLELKWDSQFPSDEFEATSERKNVKLAIEKSSYKTKLNVEEKHFVKPHKQEHLETLRLIESYKKFPILWNPNTTDGRSFKNKRAAYESISNILTNEFLIPMSLNAVRQKIKNLRQQYKDYLMKLKKGVESKLWYLPLLDVFLKDNINKSMRSKVADSQAKEPTKEPKPLDLPFRFKQNMQLNIDLIELLQKSPTIWQSEDFTFKISTNLIKVLAFQHIKNELNAHHALQLDDNNLLMLLHDLCDWFKREKERQNFFNTAQNYENLTFTPSSPECWKKMQFLASYSFQPDEYICDICHNSTKFIHRYLIDYCSHSSQLPHKCFYCDKRFVDITNCRTHECRKHSKILNYTCEFCRKKFAHATDALIHKRRFHTFERPFVCEICGKNFVTSYDMKRHRKWHITTKKIKCKKCPACFNERTSLQHHMKHYHAKDKTFDFCNEDFSATWKLEQHLEKMHADKKYKCDFCNQQFVSSLALDSHLKLMHYNAFKSENNVETMQVDYGSEEYIAVEVTTKDY